MSPKELRSRRLALRLTTAALAADLGLPTATVDAWERGEVPIEDAAALARRLAEIESRSGKGPTAHTR